MGGFFVTTEIIPNLTYIFNVLIERENRLINLAHIKGATLQEIGDEIGVSRQVISRRLINHKKGGEGK